MNYSLSRGACPVALAGREKLSGQRFVEPRSAHKGCPYQGSAECHDRHNRAIDAPAKNAIGKVARNTVPGLPTGRAVFGGRPRSCSSSAFKARDQAVERVSGGSQVSGQYGELYVWLIAAALSATRYRERARRGWCLLATGPGSNL